MVLMMIIGFLFLDSLIMYGYFKCHNFKLFDNFYLKVKTSNILYKNEVCSRIYMA